MDHWFNKLNTIFNRRTIAFFVAAALMLFTVSIATAATNHSSTTASAPPTTTVMMDSSNVTQIAPAAPSKDKKKDKAKRKKKPIKLTPEEIRYLAVTHVNALKYSYGHSDPAVEAFRIVTAQRGWTPEQTQSWVAAAAHIMSGESGFCPNLLRGAVLASINGCVLARQGPYEDAGFAQLIGIHYKIGPNHGSGWLCIQEGLCSKWEIIASPWNSMTSFVALIERSGVAPWCYNDRARSIHWKACSNPGYDV